MKTRGQLVVAVGAGFLLRRRTAKLAGSPVRCATTLHPGGSGSPPGGSIRRGTGPPRRAGAATLQR
ncbi:hypothetical protein C5613_39880 [Rhodococcus opacus]|uniref:Uncharacterized protein n=1 Tax=Rhodococcus opacus TaxID=37919 RepID=A0A2S8IJB7_RHOOP|nr:hypothetical protein C5613_39880 [Rhodococcus opacus]